MSVGDADRDREERKVERARGRSYDKRQLVQRQRAGETRVLELKMTAEDDDFQITCHQTILKTV